MAATDELVGTWKMVSWKREVVATGDLVEPLGPNPIGYLWYQTDGRMTVLEVSDTRTSPRGPVPTADEKRALFDSMLSYAGTYELDEDKVVHHVDISWNQAWTGTQQVRYYSLDGDILTIRSAAAPDPLTGQEVVHRVVWRRHSNSKRNDAHLI